DEDAVVRNALGANPKSQIPNSKSQATTNYQRPTTNFPNRLIALMGVLLVFSLGNSADAFLLLRLGDAFGGPKYVPLMWAAIHVVKASLSTWAGGLSDRIGRKTTIIIGWLVYAIVYLGFAL